MKTEEIISLFEKTKVLQYGHFILSSGKRSGTYCQCSKLFIDPKIANRVCNELTKKIKTQINKTIDYVATPALGGVLVGYEIARCLETKSVFFERVNKKFELRRGFHFKNDSNVLFVEDVITTGKATNECLEKLSDMNINLVGIACIIDRSEKKVLQEYDVISLLKLNIPIFEESELPEELKNFPATKPGSREI